MISFYKFVPFHSVHIYTFLRRCHCVLYIFIHTAYSVSSFFFVFIFVFFFLIRIGAACSVVCYVLIFVLFLFFASVLLCAFFFHPSIHMTRFPLRYRHINVAYALLAYKLLHSNLIINIYYCFFFFFLSPFLSMRFVFLFLRFFFSPFLQTKLNFRK